ncbi:TMEM164 family [Novymonas esmeraldas]|uniref:TMEM164 family n=1 Tax=Novymonas esmeraldas TaxID=1808958 RepID=A0AAW0ESP7_9TRYP
MDAKVVAWCEYVVPDAADDALRWIASRTGLRWGVMPKRQYWFQSPKLHVVLCALAMIFCVVLYRQSRGFRAGAVARLTARGRGRSLRCPLNKLIAYVLMLCMAGQVVAKLSRPKPLVQLGWLLMPCHIFTACWIHLFLRDAPRHYGRGCYLASLLVDWMWSPLGALAQPDWGDHQYFWEGHMFFVHHALLVLLPVYFAARYDTLGLDWAHVCHFTWLPTFVNFAVFVPCALLLGLNVNYQLSPPRLGRSAPAVLATALYRPPFVVLCVLLSIGANAVVRLLGKIIHAVCATTSKLVKLD